jgi:hypothetical protein
MWGVVPSCDRYSSTHLRFKSSDVWTRRHVQLHTFCSIWLDRGWVESLSASRSLSTSSAFAPSLIRKWGEGGGTVKIAFLTSAMVCKQFVNKVHQFWVRVRGCISLLTKCISLLQWTPPKRLPGNQKCVVEHKGLGCVAARFHCFLFAAQTLVPGCTSVEMHPSRDAPSIVSTFIIPKGLRHFVIS